MNMMNLKEVEGTLDTVKLACSEIQGTSSQASWKKLEDAAWNFCDKIQTLHLNTTCFDTAEDFEQLRSCLREL